MSGLPRICGYCQAAASLCGVSICGPWANLAAALAITGRDTSIQTRLSGHPPCPRALPRGSDPWPASLSRTASTKVDNRFRADPPFQLTVRACLQLGAPLTITVPRPTMTRTRSWLCARSPMQTVLPGRSQGRPDPFAAEICRGRRARGRDRAHDRRRAGGITDSTDDSDVAARSHERKKTCCAAWKASSRRKIPTRMTASEARQN